MFKRKISTLGLRIVVLLLSSLFLSGCSGKPFLTQDGSYVILSVLPSGMAQSEVINLPWNSNTAVMQKLLNECSFVLSDLHTLSDEETSNVSQPNSTSLQANFSVPKRMIFMVDHHNLTLDVQSLQIEVEGPNMGQVLINQTIVLQGIKNPNLQPAFEALVNMLHDKEP